MANKTSQHILGTSANLLGFCLFIITSFHLTNRNETGLVDELTSVIALLLTVSSVFSFISIRTDNAEKEIRMERIADIFFLSSLFGILGIILFIIIHFWGK